MIYTYIHDIELIPNKIPKNPKSKTKPTFKRPFPTVLNQHREIARINNSLIFSGHLHSNLTILMKLQFPPLFLFKFGMRLVVQFYQKVQFPHPQFIVYNIRRLLRLSRNRHIATCVVASGDVGTGTRFLASVVISKSGILFFVLTGRIFVLGLVLQILGRFKEDFGKI